MRGKLWFCAAALAAVALLTACSGAEVPASAVPPASSEVPAPSEPEPEPEPPSEPDSSSASSEPASSSQPEEPKPWDDMVVPEGYTAEWGVVSGVLTLRNYDTGGRAEVTLPTGKPYAVGMNCFEGNWKLTTITIPADVVEIGQSAFLNCTNLKTVRFAEGKTLKINQNAFEYTGLTYVELPASLKELGKYTFAHCPKLVCAKVQGITTIQEGTFEYCTALATVVLGKDVCGIEANAFADCSELKTVYYDGDWAELKPKIAAGNVALLNAERKTGTPTT